MMLLEFSGAQVQNGMDKKLNSTYKHLQLLVKQLETFSRSNAEDENNPLDGGLRAYKGWAEISATFLQFLNDKDVAEWSRQECNLIEKLMLLDWRTHLLLKNLSDSELVKVIQRPYPSSNIRMYMLVKAGLRDHSSISEAVALHFYSLDDDQAIRLRAFEVLARYKWNAVDEEAKTLWQLGDTLTRMSVLQALKAAKSSLLDHYIQEAMMSSDEIVKTIANSILYGP